MLFTIRNSTAKVQHFFEIHKRKQVFLPFDRQLSPISRYDAVHDCENVCFGVGAEEGDAGLLEVGKTFEDRRSSVMTA